MDVEPFQERRIVFQGLPVAEVRQFQGIWQRRVCQGEGRCPGDCARHVRHTIVHNAVYHIGGIIMVRCPRRLDASALVDGNINDYRPFLHNGKHVPGDELRRPCTCHKNTAYYQIRVGKEAQDILPIGHDRLHLPSEYIIEMAQPVQVNVQDEDDGACPHRHLGGVCSHYTSTQNNDNSRIHAGYAAQKHASACPLFVERVFADLN
ncbi:MAG: hypothetical protein A4E57_04833 [Syntrophorhabdaceae bacterium PtaU1.Bin034]|nr:MAG: hypothetical protein A4E57_04833 [Syntrophorhabdaceae bacterium PtaU1.Bin034]